MNDNFEKQITELIDKAAKVNLAHVAMNFTQAALNAAHAAQVLETIKREKQDR